MKTVGTAVAAILLALASQAAAQDAYPNKTITMIVPFAAGSGSDILARILGERHYARKNIAFLEAIAGGAE